MSAKNHRMHPTADGHWAGVKNMPAVDQRREKRPKYLRWESNPQSPRASGFEPDAYANSATEV